MAAAPLAEASAVPAAALAGEAPSAAVSAAAGAASAEAAPSAAPGEAALEAPAAGASADADKRARGKCFLQHFPLLQVRRPCYDDCTNSSKRKEAI